MLLLIVCLRRQKMSNTIVYLTTGTCTPYFTTGSAHQVNSEIGIMAVTVFFTFEYDNVIFMSGIYMSKKEIISVSLSKSSLTKF